MIRRNVWRCQNTAEMCRWKGVKSVYMILDPSVNRIRRLQWYKRMHTVTLKIVCTHSGLLQVSAKHVTILEI